jgi:hypothetical protein
MLFIFFVVIGYVILIYLISSIIAELIARKSLTDFVSYLIRLLFLPICCPKCNHKRVKNVYLFWFVRCLCDYLFDYC